MNSARWMVLTIAALATALACKKPAPPPAQVEPLPSAAAPVATTAVPTPEPAETAPVEAVASPDEDISVPEDFEGEVAKTITEKNYKAELDKIDKEIAATPE